MDLNCVANKSFCKFRVTKSDVWPPIKGIWSETVTLTFTNYTFILIAPFYIISTKGEQGGVRGGFLDINCQLYSSIFNSLAHSTYFGEYWREEETDEGIKPSWNMSILSSTA